MNECQFSSILQRTSGGQFEVIYRRCFVSCMDFIIGICHYYPLGFPGGSESKDSACNAGDLGSIPESGRSPGGGNGNPLQYSCPENSLIRGTWRATGLGVTKSQTGLSD